MREASTVLGNYRLGELLATGGMGEVFTGWRARDRRPVAIKRMREGKISPSEARRHFETEARILRACDHPGVVGFVDAVLDVDAPYLVMERLQGNDLLVLLGWMREHRRSLSYGEVLAIMLPLTDALHHVHVRARAVHRDVSPGNVMLGLDGRVTLVDFGIAWDAQAGARVVDDHVLGKLPYVAPEYCLRGQLDPRADVFATGVLMWELLVGHKPFDVNREPREVLNQIATCDLPSVGAIRADVPAELERVLIHATARDPDLRWGSMAEFHVGLQRTAAQISATVGGAVVRALARRAGERRRVRPQGWPGLSGASMRRPTDHTTAKISTTHWSDSGAITTSLVGEASTTREIRTPTPG